VTGPTLYGQAQSEKRAEENNVCRQIVREINNFGITQRQTLMLMYLLASELENVEHMRTLTRIVRELGGSDLFLIGTPEPDREIGDEPNGTPDV
jgi:hypothetical protein